MLFSALPCGSYVLGPRYHDLVVAGAAAASCPWRCLQTKKAEELALSKNRRQIDGNIIHQFIEEFLLPLQPAVAERLIDCDAIFLAAASMQARLVVNAICHQ